MHFKFYHKVDTFGDKITRNMKIILKEFKLKECYKQFTIVSGDILEIKSFF